ncbi:hypothetical protein AAHH78_35930, partial [Burkholderia pseudomallei]
VYGDGASEAPLAELGPLFDLKEAHLVMLGATRIVAPEGVRPLLDAHRRLRRAGYAPLLAGPRPRGLYMLVEAYLIETLGEDVGG